MPCLGPPLVYHPQYSCQWPREHRFPMWKFADTFAVLKRQRWFTMSRVHTPLPLPDAAFTAVHDASYYRAFCEGRLDEAAARRIGFRDELQKPALIQRTKLECAGTVRAAQLALEHGMACNVAGGTHHAHRDFGSGFTILNDLAIAAVWARRHGWARRIAIVDLDVHQGDGTASIFASEPEVFTLSMHCGKNFPFRKAVSDLDVDVPVGTSDSAYLAMLRAALPAALRDFRPDLVLYDAGVDVFSADKLGWLELSHAGLWRRDVHVLEACVDAGVPVCTVIGGGYESHDRAAELARRHAIVFRAAAHVWRRRGMGENEDRVEGRESQGVSELT